MPCAAGRQARVVMTCLLVALLVPGLASLATAQTVTFGSSIGFSPAGLVPEPEVKLAGVALGPADLEFRLAGLVAGPLELGMAASTSLSYGPIGTIRLEGLAQADTGGAFRLSLAGTGVIASVAARAHLSVFNTDAGRFELPSAYQLEAPRRSGAGRFGVALELGGSYRLQRRLIASLDPGVRYVAAAGWGAHLTGSLEFRDFNARDDGALLLLADLAPGGSGAYAAAGFEYRLGRSGLPLIRASMWLGAGTRGVFPGLRLAVTGGTRSSKLGYGFELAAEPYRHDVLPLRSRSYLSARVAGGELLLSALIGYDSAGELPPFALGLSYSTSLR